MTRHHKVHNPISPIHYHNNPPLPQQAITRSEPTNLTTTTESERRKRFEGVRRERPERREKKRIKKVALLVIFFFATFLANGKVDEATFLLFGVLVHPILMFLQICISTLATCQKKKKYSSLTLSISLFSYHAFFLFSPALILK